MIGCLTAFLFTHKRFGGGSTQLSLNLNFKPGSQPRKARRVAEPEIKSATPTFPKFPTLTLNSNSFV